MDVFNSFQVSDIIKAEVAEALSEPSELSAAAGTAQFSSKTPLWQQPNAHDPTGREIVSALWKLKLPDLRKKRLYPKETSQFTVFSSNEFCSISSNFGLIEQNSLLF